MSQEGEPLIDIPAGTSTGEMGLFTGSPRSATIVASANSMGIVFARDRLRILMDSEPRVKGVVLQNVVDLLAERLVDTDRRLAEQMRRVADLEEKQEAELEEKKLAELGEEQEAESEGKPEAE